MRIVAHVHYFPPYHFAGSELMVVRIFQKLQELGHEVIAVASQEGGSPDESWEFNGITCYRPRRGYSEVPIVQALRPDLILTHHQCTPQAVHVGRKILNVPVVQLIHNDMIDNLYWGADFVIYNTNFLQEKLSKQYDYPSIVVHPPVYAEEHATTPGDKVTLVNLNMHKGSMIFYELARRLPDVQFLGVEGGHGPQIFEAYPNVTFQRQTTDMKNDVWSRTKILLTPSVYESYGMVAIEACASGIPVIANPTFGLEESLDYAGIFVDRDDIDGYEEEIRKLLDNPSYYQSRSSLARARSDELDPDAELLNAARKLEELIE